MYTYMYLAPVFTCTHMQVYVSCYTTCPHPQGRPMDQPQGMGGMPPQAQATGYPQQRVQTSAAAPGYGSPAGGGYAQPQQAQQQQQYQQQATGYGQYNGRV